MHGSLAPVHFLPILTTLLSAGFVAALLARASGRRWPPHLLWWAVGVFFYGFGTAIEATITLRYALDWGGNTPTLTRLWYWAGAILGGYPLATGSVYLLLPRRTAHLLTSVSLLVVAAATVAVFLTPIDASLLEPHRPSGKVIVWTWVRLMTPAINLYAAVFLIGGAVWSSVGFMVWRYSPRRAVGTALIAIGAMLPGIGGAMAKMDIVEALYFGEFVGLVLIIIGYVVCLRAPAPCTEGTVAAVAGAR